MQFQESMSTCFIKFSDFSGRAVRSEYWWFILFVAVGSVVCGRIGSVVEGVFQLAVFVPMIAVGARRLHDTNRSGWLQLLWLIPLVGWIIVISFMAELSKEPKPSVEPNPPAT
jgi:uncharacterized membrane protein YhaH (DUF805 family)